MNSLKTAVLMALLTALLVMAGGSVGGHNGAMLMLVFSLLINFISYWKSDSIVLSMYGAKEVTRAQAPELYDLVATLARQAKLPMPRVCIINDQSPNAFATGRNPEHAAVAVTTGIMRILDQEELGGVIAHELSHIKHRDTLISTVAGSLAGVISSIGHMAQWAMIFGMGGRRSDDDGEGLGAIFTIIVAPLAAALIQLAISRSREYAADRSGGEICGNPLDLASALEKLEYYSGRMSPMADAGPATAHLFIVNPLKNTGFSFKSMFSTHPSTEDRVAALKEQAREMGIRTR